MGPVLLAGHHVEVAALAAERLSEETLCELGDLWHVLLCSDGRGGGVAVELWHLARF